MNTSNYKITKLVDLMKSDINKCIKECMKRTKKITPESFFSMMCELCSNEKSSYQSVVSDFVDVHDISSMAFHKFRSKVDYKHIETIFNNLYKKTRDVFGGKQKIYAVDGSRIRLNVKIPNYPYHTNGHFKEGLLSCLYNCTDDIPYNMVLTGNHNEREVCMEQLKTLPYGSVVVFDRGYYSFDMYLYCVKLGIKPIFRIKENASNQLHKLYKNKYNDISSYISKNNKKIFVRIVKYTINNTKYVLLTNLISNKYSIKHLKGLYHERWRVEEGFKLMKNNLNLNDIKSKNENFIKQELYINGILHIFSKTIEHDAIKTNNIDRNKYKLNNKCIVNTVIKKMYKLLNTVGEILGELVYRLVCKIIKQRTPIRNNRHFERKVKKPSSKYKS